MLSTLRVHGTSPRPVSCSTPAASSPVARQPARLRHWCWGPARPACHGGYAPRPAWRQVSLGFPPLGICLFHLPPPPPFSPHSHLSVSRKISPIPESSPPCHCHRLALRRHPQNLCLASHTGTISPHPRRRLPPAKTPLVAPEWLRSRLSLAHVRSAPTAPSQPAEVRLPTTRRLLYQKVAANADPTGPIPGPSRATRLQHQMDSQIPPFRLLA